MTAKELSRYLAYADDDIDLVVITREKYEKLRKKAFFYDDLRKYFEKHLTKAGAYDIIKTQKEREAQKNDTN